MTANLTRHLQRKHPATFTQFQEGSKIHASSATKRPNTSLAKAAKDPKQAKISDYTGTEATLQSCVELAVHHSVAFQTFNYPPMQMLTKFAKIGCGDTSRKVINAENVKIATSKCAAEKREEITKVMTGKIINLMADFATCERRSFFGKFVVPNFTISTVIYISHWSL